MNNFERCLLRLKENLSIGTDKRVAELLGMSASALNDRKRRDSFPEDRLLALKARRPDLEIDDTYILTGLARDHPYRKNAELAKRTTRCAEGLSGPINDELNKGLSEIAEEGGQYMDEARKAAMRQRVAALILESGLEEDDLQAIASLAELIVKKNQRSN